jgi:hypothetical protein
MYEGIRRTVRGWVRYFRMEPGFGTLESQNPAPRRRSRKVDTIHKDGRDGEGVSRQ